MTEQKREYSYDDLFPERWLHAPDLDGRTVTLAISDLYAETIVNPKTKQKDDCGIVTFYRTPREYVLSKQNAWILKTVFGPAKADVVDKRITISPVPDTSGFTEHGIRILFTGSPDIDADRRLTLPGGKAITFKKTKPNRADDADGIDPVTGEVIDAAAEEDFGFTEDAPYSDEAAGDTGSGQDDDATPAVVTSPAGADSDADGQIPGLGAAEVKARNAKAGK